MNISDIALWHRWEAEACRADGVGDEGIGHDAFADFLQKYQKELTELAQEWRQDQSTYGDPLYTDGYDAGMDRCADQLESLINPKG